MLLLPTDVLYEIMDYIPDIDTLRSMAMTCKELYQYFRYEISREHYKKLVERLSQVNRWTWNSLVESNSLNWYNMMSILHQRCQICGKKYENGFCHPIWKLYAEPSCIKQEVIHIKKAMEQYDFTFDDVSSITNDRGMVWKYHGGRQYLYPLDLMHDTLQGLCLKLYDESLFDRKQKKLEEQKKYEIDCEKSQANFKRMFANYLVTKKRKR